mgnify:CR=1 FL=1
MSSVLSFSRVSYEYPGGRAALRDVSFSVEAGESLALIGPSGAGKTTLLLHANGLLRGRGEVRVGEEPVSRENISRIRARIGFVFQDPNDQIFMPTVIEDVLFGPLNAGWERPAAVERAARILESFGLGGELETSPDRLSLGQKKKAALAGVMIMDPALVILDEPTANLDPGSRRRLIGDLGRLGGTRISASHDLDFVWETCRRAVLLDKGAVVADGDCRELLRDGELLEAHGLEVPLSARLADGKE